MAIQYAYGAVNPVIAPVATATNLNVADLCALVSGEVVSAADFTWDTDEATTQTNFVAAFLGASAQNKDANKARVYGNSTDNTTRVDCSGVFVGDYSGNALKVGDFVGLSSASNKLLPQNLVAVGTSAKAVGRAVEAASGTGKVKFQLLSTLNPVAK